MRGQAETQGKDAYQATTTNIGKGKQELRDIPQSVTVITDDGHHWNVAPSLLTRAAAPTAAKPEARPNLVRLK